MASEGVHFQGLKELKEFLSSMPQQLSQNAKK